MKTLSASRSSVTSSGLGTECCAAEGPSTCHNDMERVSCDWWSDGHVTSTRALIGAGGHAAAGLLQHLPQLLQRAQPGQPPASASRGRHLHQPVHAPEGLLYKYYPDTDTDMLICNLIFKPAHSFSFGAFCSFSVWGASNRIGRNQGQCVDHVYW